MLLLPTHLGSQPLNSPKYVTTFLVLGTPKLGYSTLDAVSQGPSGAVGIISLRLLPTLLLIHPMMQLALFAAGVHGWLMFSLLSTNTPRAFLPPTCPARQKFVKKDLLFLFTHCYDKLVNNVWTTEAVEQSYHNKSRISQGLVPFTHGWSSWSRCHSQLWSCSIFTSVSHKTLIEALPVVKFKNKQTNKKTKQKPGHLKQTILLIISNLSFMKKISEYMKSGTSTCPQTSFSLCQCKQWPCFGFQNVNLTCLQTMPRAKTSILTVIFLRLSGLYFSNTWLRHEAKSNGSNTSSFDRRQYTPGMQTLD